jgi:hypothetical protein
VRIICLLLWSWTLLLSSTAQLKTPNDAGISAANVGVLYTDAGSHKQFWTALGGVELDLGKKRFNPLGIPVNPTVFSFPGIAIYGLRGSQQLTLPSTTSASLSVPPGGQATTAQPSSVIEGTEGSTNLEPFMKRLGREFNVITRYQTVDSQFAPLKSFARIRDPFGTVIELTEGFRDVVR